MRVWIENPFDNLPGEGHRPGRYEMMSAAFAAAGHEVTFWSSDFSHTRKCHRSPVPPPGTAFTLRIIPTPAYRRNVSLARCRSHRAYAATFAQMAADEIAAGKAPELLIVSSPPLSTAAPALAIRRRTGCRLIVDVQDAWPETFYRLLPKPLRFLGSLLFAPLHRTARSLYTSADAVTVVAERYLELVRAAGARRIARFPLGIRPPAPPDNENRAPKSAGDSIAVVYIGNLGRGYDLETAVRALAMEPRLHLHLAAAAGEVEIALRTLAESLQVADRFHFHGYLHEAELYRLLRDCHVGLIPMLADSFVGLPNKLADYAAADLPVVSSLAGECADLLRRTNSGVGYVAGDSSSLVDAIHAVTVANCQCTPELLLRELDATRIYPEYVKFATSL